MTPTRRRRRAALERGADRACSRRASPGRSPTRRRCSSRRRSARSPARSTEALAAAPPDCVVSDVGSTKRAIVAAHDDPRFVGGHPLAGAETSGVEHARADLFDGATWYLTPGLGDVGRALRAPAPAAAPASAPARPRSTPQTARHNAGDRLAPAPRRRQRPRRAGRAGAVGRGRAAAGDRSELSRRHARRRRVERRSGPTSTSPTATRWRRRSSETIARLAAFATRSIAGDEAGSRLERRCRDRPAPRCSRPKLAGGPLYELRASVPNRPGRRRRARARARAGPGVNITDMALYPAPDMSDGVVALWIAGERRHDGAQELVGGSASRWPRAHERALRTVRSADGGR